MRQHGDNLVDPQKPNILFLSHAAVDEEIAIRLKVALASAFPGLDVFVSSDPEDLPPGNPWVETVLLNLREALAIWVLASERGLGRKWVWFESGAGWAKKNQFIPCCLGKVRKGHLPAPYSQYIAVNIDEEQDLSVMFEGLANQLGIALPQVDYSAIARDMVRLDVRAEERAKTQTSLFAAEVSARVIDGMANLGPHQIEGIRQLLIEGQLTDRRAIVLVQKTFSVSRHPLQPTLAIFGEIESKTGFVRRVVPQGDLVRSSLGYQGPWEINPNLKFEIEAYFKKHEVA